jgi:glycosyltransferase involved in cell wall biosynthesis
MVALEKAQRLRAKGVDVITAVLPDTPLKDELEKSGLSTLILRPGSKYFSPSTVWRLRRTIRQNQVQAVLVQHLRDLWYMVPALMGFKKVRLVGVAHMFLAVNKRDGLHRWIYGRLNYLIALTGLHKQNLLTYLPVQDAQVKVFPNTVDADRFSPDLRSSDLRRELGIPSTCPLIGVVSRLDPQKGLLEVTRAAAELRARGVEFRLVIVGAETRGEEDFRAVLENEITTLELEDRVKLLGHRADVAEIMASLDVLLMSAPAETFGRVLIEAMASQVAIVACAGGGVRDVIDDEVNGLLVPPGDANAMATALKRLLSDDKLRQRLAKSGLWKARSTYDPRRVEEALDQLLL